MSAQETIADKNKAHWNNVAETYETGDPAGIKIAQDAADAMLKKYPFDENSTTLLEFACGTGVVSRRLATYCLDVTGVDISENMIKLYNKFAEETPNKDKMKGYVFDLINSTQSDEEDKLKGMLFDVIVCAQAYHHFEDVVDATKKLAIYLKPSGSLFIVDNTWFRWNTEAEGAEGQHQPAHHHHHDHGHPYHRFHHEATQEEDGKLRTAYEAAMGTIAHKAGFKENDVKELFEAAGLTEDFDFTILGQYDRAGMSSEAFVAKAAKPGTASGMHNGNSIKLLTGNSHIELAQAVADHLGIHLVPCVVKKFSNGELNVTISESIRDEDVFILQTGCADTNDHLMELLILISACKTASARRITAVVPCYPYARHDKKDQSRAPITAKLVANMLAVAGCDHLITMDLHASQIQGFFEVPVDNLYSEPLMIRYIKTEIEGWRDSIIVSPDAGGAKRATAIADKLKVDFGLINRSRDLEADSGPSRRDSMKLLVGDVKDKVVILVDDMIDTGSTVAMAAKTLKENGAGKIYCLISHGLLAEANMANIAALPIERLVVTNTIPQKARQQSLRDADPSAQDRLIIIDISQTIAESIRRTHNGESISLLFDVGPLSTV
ncbi:hypothetical protein FRC01_012148 [Tulasnella sp. 417]|nr:hypothetical protein FRC01_012148 [Tulasnella sp. 417]